MHDEESFERIRKAVEARDRFLKEHPELQPLQEEITALMQKLGSRENRMAVLDGMMREKLMELQRRLSEMRQAFLELLPEDFDLEAALEAQRGAAPDGRADGATPDRADAAPDREDRDAARDREDRVDRADAARDREDPTGKNPPEGGRILGPAGNWPVPDGITGRDRPGRRRPPAAQRPIQPLRPPSTGREDPPADRRDEDRGEKEGGGDGDPKPER